jgi:hypothetical protein
MTKSYDSTYVNPSNQKRHVQPTHIQMNNNVTTCERCGHDAKTKGNLIQHLGKMKECSATFSQRSRSEIIASLTRPKKTKVHQCKYCDLKFSSHQGKHQHGITCPMNPTNTLHTRVLTLEKTIKTLTQALGSMQKDLAIRDGITTDSNVGPSEAYNTQYKRKAKRSIKPRIRREVWDTHIGEGVAVSKCMCCEKIKITQHQYICGHVVADCNGGTQVIENLRPICAVCNDAMGHENMAEYKMARFGTVLK